MGNDDRHRFLVFASVILRKGNKILLMRRCNTGFDDGFFQCPGGGVDGHEPVTQAIIRETLEELGVTLNAPDLRIVHTMHLSGPGRSYEYLNFFAETNKWDGEPTIMEPHKCDGIGWFSLNQLPDTLMPSVKHVIESVGRGVPYSEYGW